MFISQRILPICITVAFTFVACSYQATPESFIVTSIPTEPLETPTQTTPALATPTLAAASPEAPTWTPVSEPTATLTETPTRPITNGNGGTTKIGPTPPPNLPTILLSACNQTIWEPGIYKLTADLKTTGPDCFYVQSHNVVIDCDNHTIEGKDYKGYAFFVRKWGFPLEQTPTNVEIKNCKITRHRTGIFVGGGNNVYIHHNDLSGNLDDVNKERFGIFLGMTEGGGLRLDTVKGGRVEFNTTNREAIGIDIRDSDGVVVRNNTASTNSAWGISLLNTSNSQIVGNITRDNVRWCVWGNGTIGPGCDAAGIMLQDGASSNLVAGNTVDGENGNGIFIKAHGSRCGNNNVIEGNKILDAKYSAIEFSFCTGNKVIGNEISGSYDAVWFGFSSDTEVRGNTIRNMRNHGISSFNSRGSIVKDNVISNSNEGIYFFWSKWDPKAFYFLKSSPDDYASRDNTIVGNTLQSNAVAGIHLSNSTQNRVTGNTFSKNGKNIWLEGKTDGSVVDGLQ